jgi:hypothetical protein
LSDLREVSAVLAEGNYVLLQRMSGANLLRDPISVVASGTPIHSDPQVRARDASLVEEIEARPTGDYHLRVRVGEEYTVTRRYEKNLKSLPESWIGMDPFIT